MLSTKTIIIKKILLKGVLELLEVVPSKLLIHLF